jgi:hypothetical protein
MDLQNTLFWHEKIALMKVGDTLPVTNKQSTYSAIRSYFKEPFIKDELLYTYNFSVRTNEQGTYVVRKNDKPYKKNESNI